MKKILLGIMALVCAINTYAQHNLKIIVKNSTDKSPLSGATVSIPSLNKTAYADSTGLVSFSNLPAGSFTLTITYADMKEKELPIAVPQPVDRTIEVLMEEGEEEEEEVIISATRNSRSISDIPTRVETISGEEIAEKGNMKPGDIRMMLNESTGIQTQQTSPTSYNSSIRIQGLDGRYTQILRDGFPLYAGFSGGLSLMQVAPLDLKQIEVIKGSSSTLYGGGAIAGLVNLVSKIPTTKKELSFLANATTAKGLDLSAFYSQKFKRIGLTIFGSRNTSTAYDPANIGFTAIPEFNRYTINPRLFIYGKKTSADIGISYINEDRTGGSMDHIKNGTPGYYEKNLTDRFTSQVSFQHSFNDKSRLNLKSSYSDFTRFVNIPSYIFEGTQRSSYTELNFTHKGEKTFWITGLNLLTDNFREKPHNNFSVRDYAYTTTGIFIQNTWTPIPGLSIEAGIRGDHVKEYGFALLPRISAMWKPTHKVTIRLGGGLGYKTPTVFNEEAEKIQFRNILPIDHHADRNERSFGTNLDLNYRTRAGKLGISINQLFFYTRINKPIVLTSTGGFNFEFVNSPGYIDTKGLETNLRFTYQHFKLFIGYTYSDVNTNFNQLRSSFPLTAKHRLNNVLMYEVESKLKLGLEAYYFSPQILSDGSTGRSYWINGFMAEKFWEKFSLFINFENFFDTRQTRFGPIYTGSINDPVFKDIYAPVDGFVVNGGVKIRL